MKSHGSGEASKSDHLVPWCEECRAHKRAQDRRQRATPGTYAYERGRKRRRGSR